MCGIVSLFTVSLRMWFVSLRVPDAGWELPGGRCLIGQMGLGLQLDSPRLLINTPLTPMPWRTPSGLMLPASQSHLLSEAHRAVACSQGGERPCGLLSRKVLHGAGGWGPVSGPSPLHEEGSPHGSWALLHGSP